jgi:hypothetical protein
MTLISIPDRIVPGFKALFSLSNEVRHLLVDHITSRPVGTSLKSLIESIPKEIQGKKDELSVATSILNSVFSAREASELSIEDFIPDFIEALDEANVNPGNKEEFGDLLRKLLSHEKYRSLNKKFIELVGEGERLITETRIVTDIRPMVDDGDDKSIVGLAIIHQLRITFRNNNQEESLYFLLNGSDLASLEKVIQRAKNKEDHFKNTFTTESQVFYEEK